MSNEMKTILSHMMATATLVRQCKKELLNMGFTEDETQELLHFYIYDNVNEED